MNNLTKKLPDKLSELILLALADLEWIEAKSDKYEIDMDVWHYPRNNSKICLKKTCNLYQVF